MKKIKLDIQKFAADNTVEVELIAAAEELEKSMNSAMKSIRNLKGTVKETKDEVTGFKKVAKDISNAFDLSKGLDIRGITNQIKRLGRSLYTDFLSKAVDTSEELNLFNVVFNNIERDGVQTFSKLGREATQFQNKLNEAFGTNKKETMHYQGLFQAMGESAGLSEDVSKLMSENMTKLAYDLASLYNTTETKAAESLRAGVYAGQTKPLRNYGIDVTQTSFKPIMEELGLEKSVNELTQAEKEVLRYISTLRQAGNAMGDFANTIESPANQLKVLKQQFYEMQAAIGNLFVGAFARILPYVNGIIMAIKEVAKAIASLFGIKMKDYNTGIASYTEDLDDYSEGLGGIADSAGSAGDAIKALKRQTLGFDQINNLTSPTPTSKGGSGGGGGAGGGLLDGIDSRLLDALKGYENGMEKVRMKATQIRDKIMSILGFTKHINAETGETYFTYDGWQATVKGLWGWFKELNPLAKFFVGIGLPAAFVTLFNIIRKISRTTGVTTVLKGILTISKNLLSPLGALSTSMLAFGKAALSGEKSFSSLRDGLSLGVQSWREEQGIIDKTTGKLNGFTGVVQGTKNVLLGLGEAAAGIYILGKSIDDLTRNGANLGNVMGTAGGTIMTVFGGIQAGAVFGPWGAAIGGVITAVAVLTTVVLNANDELSASIKDVNEVTEANKKYFDSLKEVREEQDRLLGESLGMTTYHQKLVDELKAITDENGNVKAGYEDRAEFIVTTLADAYGLEMYYQDGVITNYGKEIGKIDELIEKEKARIRFEAYKDKYAENIKKEAENVEKLNLQTGALQTSEENLLEARKKANKLVESESQNGIERIRVAKELKDAEDSYANAKKETKKAYKEYFETLLDNDKYERMMVENSKGNYQKVNEIVAESRDETIATLKDTMIQQAKTVGVEGEGVIDKWNALAVSSRKEYKDAISKLPEDVASQIQIMTGNIVKVTPEVVAYFANLGHQSEEKQIEELKKLPPDLQKEVIDKLKAKGEKIPEEIQKGIDSKPKPKAEINTSNKEEVQSKVNNATKDVKGSVFVGVNFPSSLSLSNTLSYLLGGVSGALNLKFSKKADGGVFANNRWQPIQAYANGGIPAGGQLFMAREAGPELVGKIGKHTAVMNNNQIVDSVKAGVYEAVSAAMSEINFGGIDFYAHTDEGVVIDKINRITRQTGECPINI